MQKGTYHDLRVIYDYLNKRYFQDQVRASIAWGRFGNRTRAYSIRLGSYDYLGKTITIHPALDQAVIPRLCVERVVHHEMLHQMFPAKTSRGRRQIHTPEFRAAEKLFFGAQLADAWFDSNLTRILHYRATHQKIW